MNYYIYDCNGQIVGNPKGYATMRGACRAEKNKTRILWDRFYAKRDSGSTDNTVSIIRQGKA